MEVDVLPEDNCRRCQRVFVPWTAPSPLWNEVMRGGDINNPEVYDGMVCPKCFCLLAEIAGVATGWRLYAVTIHKPLQTVTPSGRVWDESAWMWTEQDDGR